MLNNKKYEIIKENNKEIIKISPPFVCENKNVKIKDTFLSVFDNEKESHLKGECPKPKEKNGNEHIKRNINIKIKMDEKK